MRALIATVAAIAFLATGASATQADVSISFQEVLENHRNTLYTYPTDITREIVPVPHPSSLLSPPDLQTA